MPQILLAAVCGTLVGACVLLVAARGHSASGGMMRPGQPGGHADPELWRQSGPLLVQALGDEFYWNFRYAGPDGRFLTEDDLTTHRELCVPEQTGVMLSLTSRDFVYLLSMPDLQLRQIAVPELSHKAELPPLAPGRYEMIVDPLCGMASYHTDPMGELVVLSEADFRSWLKGSEGGL